jgi:hypothetical protein
LDRLQCICCPTASEKLYPVIHGYLDQNEKGTLKFKLLVKYETGILTPQIAEIKAII